jgi:hypothetical protein
MFDFNSLNSGSTIAGISVERRLTSALLYAGSGESPVIYEIHGHQESSLSELGLKEFIDQENYDLRELNLAQSNIPADASIVIIVSPRTGITRLEADKLLDYLDRGGRLLIMADYRIQDISMLNEVMASYGLRFDYGIVVENDPSYTAGDFYVEVPFMEEHDIINALKEKYSPVVLPFVMGISKTGTMRRSVDIAPLLSTSRNSWLRSDIFNNSAMRIDSDITGPINIAAAVMDPPVAQGSEKQTRIVAIGSSTDMSSMYGDISIFNQQFVPGGNTDLFMNSLAWLQDRPETLSVRSKSIYILPMQLTNLEIAVFAGIFVILIPLVFFIWGLVVWLKRRHL